MRKIEREKEKIYIDLTTKQVVDRFCIKGCNRCQGFKHYEKNCQNEVEVFCGYCAKVQNVKKLHQVTMQTIRASIVKGMVKIAPGHSSI